MRFYSSEPHSFLFCDSNGNRNQAFKINIVQNIPDALNSRLKNTRRPAEIANSRKDYGKPIKYLKPQKKLKKLKNLPSN
ncbi:MAG: hypothetical protein QG646_1311 [Euryarchaeota archaeon]|nr:hypothetical protein [Euryarchaeota archaeon]